MKPALASIFAHSRTRGIFRTLAVLAAVSLASVITARAAQAPPHNISAANFTVIQNDTGNTVDSVTVTAPLTINDLRVRPGSNRGDYNIQVGDTGTDDLADGFPLVTVAQNGRDNGELGENQPNYAAPAFDGGVNGYWAVLQDLTSDRAEYNINCSVAYFRYTNWYCGWARNIGATNGATNNLLTATPGLVNGTHFKWVRNGEFRVDLRAFGINSTNSGVLLVNHAKNEGNYCSSYINSTGPNAGTWEVFVKDNFGNTTSLEQDPAAFVFIPKTNTTVVSGRFGLDASGTNAAILAYSGASPAFTVTNLEAGRYRLTIPGGAPDAGVLVLSSESATNTSAGFDNTVSYQPDGNGWIIESRDCGVFPPPLEATTNEPVAGFLYIPAATAGVTVSPTNTLVTSEFGQTASFNIQLDLAPTNDVTINISSSNPAEGVVSTNVAIFNSTNWNTPQTITVTGQDDALVDGAVAYTIVLDPAVSGDVRYNGINPADVAVINVDDEQPGITVTPTTGLRTTESGGTATFAVFLNRQPSDSVTIGLTSGNLAEGTVSPTSLTFDSSNWSTAQIVTVTGVDDFRKDGNIGYTIVTAPAVSADANYNGINPPDVAVVNLDNETPALVWNYPTQLDVPEGGTATYSVVLTTQPDANVVVSVASSNTAIATVSPATVTFTPGDWSTPKIITVTGVDNFVPNVAPVVLITNVVSSTDPAYQAFSGDTRLVVAVVLDNEVHFTLPSGDCIYGLGMPAIGIDGQASLTDSDVLNYNNGSLNFALTTNGTAADVLAIRNDGTNAGQISISGSVVMYEGNVIGNFTGGTGLTPLFISLNGNATLPAVQQLARSVTFRTPTNAASLATRNLTVTLNDGLGVFVNVEKAVRVGALRQTQYQEGGDYGYGNYFGAEDIALSQVGASTPYPIGRSPSEGLLIDWPDGGTPNESQVLLRFDDFIGTNYWQVPSNAIVVSAELLLNINNTGDGGRFYRMLMPWDATNDTWNSLGDGVDQDDVESRSVYESQLGVEDGSGATGAGVVSVGVTRDIQAWVNGETNYGWVMKGWPLRTDGTGFSCSEDVDVTERPRLRVKWLVPGYASVSFQQGIDGYTNTYDANLQQAASDVNSSGSLSIGVDYADAGGTNTTEGLLWFDNIIGMGTNQIPPGAIIHAAILELASVGSDGMGDGGQFFAVLQPWDPATTTWNTWSNGVQADGIKAALTPTAVAGNVTLNPDVQGTFNYFEVTTDVQAWANGTRPNYGWAILPWVNGSNGWFSRSSESVSLVDVNKPEAERPRLRVYYSVGTASATPAMLAKPVVSPTQIQVPFTGSAGMTYTVLRAPAIAGPWSPIGSATVAPNGQATNTDNAPLSGRAFYRVVYP